MDIRDITLEEVNDHVKSRRLQDIYRLQSNLIEHYTKIECLPNPPLVINQKDHQILLKDFLSRVVEELGEAYESYETLMTKKEAYYIWNFYEEIADALHFMIEALIYTNIFPEDIKLYLQKEVGCDYKNCTQLDLDNVWKGCFGYSRYRVLQVTHYNNLPLESLMGLIVHPLVSQQVQTYLWKVTYQIQMVRNALKNKAWKQTKMVTDRKVVNGYMIKSFLALIDACHFLGINEDLLYDLYRKKNQVNEFRVKSKY